MISKSTKYLGYNDFFLILIGVPIMSLVITGLMFSDIVTDFKSVLLSQCILVGMVHVLTFWLVFREIFFLGIKKYGGKNKRYAFIFIGIAITYFLFKQVLNYFLNPYMGDIHAYANAPHVLLESLSALLVTSIVILIYEGSYLAKRLNEVKLEKEQLASMNMASQLEGLKNKVSPHFLFNSLNTLCNLIPESPERAERFVRKLSKVYRYILEIRNRKLISLKEELEYLEAYTYLLEERFGNNIIVDIKIDQQLLGHNIVPLSLQILMENAIKHNVISKDQSLNISIYTDERKKLVVKNNLQLKRSVTESTRFGLENIKARYKYFTETLVEIIPTVNHFIVVLPLLEPTENLIEVE